MKDRLLREIVNIELNIKCYITIEEKIQKLYLWDSVKFHRECDIVLSLEE